MSAPIDELVARMLSQAVNVKYTFVSAVTLLLYNTAIGFSDVAHLIWRQRWSFGKILYIFTRYGCFIDATTALWYSFSAELSPESCRILYQFANYMMNVGINISQVLLIRAYAIWERKGYILAYSCVIQVVAMIASFILLKQSNKSVTFESPPFPTIVPCIPILGNNTMFVSFCVVVIVEFNFLCTLLVKGLSQWRRESTPLIHTLCRDGIVYFVALFFVCLINVAFLLKEFNSPYFYIATEHQRVFHSIFASRVIINVRKAFAVKEVASWKRAESFCDRISESIDFASGISVENASQCIEDSFERSERQSMESSLREGSIA